MRAEFLSEPKQSKRAEKIKNFILSNKENLKNKAYFYEMLDDFLTVCCDCYILNVKDLNNFKLFAYEVMKTFIGINADYIWDYSERWFLNPHNTKRTDNKTILLKRCFIPYCLVYCYSKVGIASKKQTDQFIKYYNTVIDFSFSNREISKELICVADLVKNVYWENLKFNFN